MGMLDIFNNSAFSTVELTDAINVVPNTFGRLQQMNLFPARGVRTTIVALERKNGVLNLLPTGQRGAPATKGAVGKRDLRHFAINHIAHEDTVLADDVQGVRAFGSENQVMAVQDLVNEKLAVMASKHDITLEFQRWGALKGILLDADGSTLLNMFTEFGISQESQNFLLTTGTTDVAAKVRALKRYMELNSQGQMYSGIHVFCSSGWFESFIQHPEVEKFYLNFMNAKTLDNDYRSGFVFQGVTFEEQNGSATDEAGNVRNFVPANEAIAFPVGAPGLFSTYFAPADFMETVNTPGLPRYAKQERMKFDRGVELHTQSNPLPLCNRPHLLVKLTRS
jgi:hypothetical protein